MCRDRRVFLSFGVDKFKRKKTKTKEQAAFIVGNRKEMCPPVRPRRTGPEDLKDVEEPPMVNVAKFYMQKTNGSAIAVILSSRYAAEYAKK